MSGLSTLLWCKGYINLSPSNSGFFKISRHWVGVFFFHLQLRFLHLPHIYMQNQSLCTKDTDTEGFRRSLAEVWCQFFSVTAPPFHKIHIATMGHHSATSVLLLYLQLHPNLASTRRGRRRVGQGSCCTSVRWRKCLLHYQKPHCCPSQRRDIAITNGVETLALLPVSLLFCFFPPHFPVQTHTQNCKAQKVLAKWKFTTELQEGKGEKISWFYSNKNIP